MTREDLSELIFSKIEKNKDFLSKQFKDSKDKIGFFVGQPIFKFLSDQIIPVSDF